MTFEHRYKGQIEYVDLSRVFTKHHAGRVNNVGIPADLLSRLNDLDSVEIDPYVRDLLKNPNKILGSNNLTINQHEFIGGITVPSTPENKHRFRSIVAENGPGVYQALTLTEGQKKPTATYYAVLDNGSTQETGCLKAATLACFGNYIPTLVLDIEQRKPKKDQVPASELTLRV